LIKQLAEQQGFRATVEATIGRNCADVLVENEERRIIFEVSLTTTAEWERDNIVAWLQTGMPQIALVLGKSLKSDSKYRDAVLAPLNEQERDRVVILTPEQLPEFMASLTPAAAPTESTVRGYKVRVARSLGEAGDAQARRKAIGRLIVRSLRAHGE